MLHTSAGAEPQETGIGDAYGGESQTTDSQDGTTHHRSTG